MSKLVNFTNFYLLIENINFKLYNYKKNNKCKKN